MAHATSNTFVTYVILFEIGNDVARQRQLYDDMIQKLFSRNYSTIQRNKFAGSQGTALQ